MDKPILQTEQQLGSIIETDEGLRIQSFFDASEQTRIKRRLPAEFVMRRMLEVQ